MENFGPNDAQNGTLDQMFRNAGIDDVRSYVDDVREETILSDPRNSTSTPSRSKHAVGNVKQIYQLVSEIFLSRSLINAFDLQFKSLDKNGDGKITVEDVEILLKEMGLGSVSKHLSRAIFNVVDANHNGQLDFQDLVALMSILKRLSSSSSSSSSSR